jgi:hypothetical protein
MNRARHHAAAGQALAKLGERGAVELVGDVGWRDARGEVGTVLRNGRRAERLIGEGRERSAGTMFDAGAAQWRTGRGRRIVAATVLMGARAVVMI